MSSQRSAVATRTSITSRAYAPLAVRRTRRDNPSTGVRTQVEIGARAATLSTTRCLSGRFALKGAARVFAGCGNAGVALV